MERDLAATAFIKRLAAGAAVILLLAGTAQAAAKKSQKAMTLREAVGISVTTYPDYGITANNRRATDEELDQAEALYRPSIDLRIDGGYEHTENPTIFNADGSHEQNLWRYNSGITLTQLLFDGGAARYENLGQQARVLSAAHRVREAAELQALAAVESYLNVLRQRKLLDIAHENVRAHQSILDKILESTRAGKTSLADNRQTASRLEAAQAEESNARADLETAEGDFLRDVGRKPGPLRDTPTPSGRLAEDVEQEVRISLADNPTISIANADYLVAQREYEGTEAAFSPKFDFQLQGQDGHNLSGLPGRNVDASALVVMNWNLYRGGADVARRRESMYREAQTKDQRAKVARGVEEDVRKTWAGMESARDRARAFSLQAANNVRVVSAYHDQFELARRTLLDVLDAQNELFVSRANAVNARYLEMFAVYRLLALKGDLLEALAISLPREADPGM